MSEIKKAKRRLSEFNFEEEGSAIALVGKHQGRPANGVHTLVTKDTKNIEKADIEVKMDMVSFLSNFFNLWTGEAATLAAILGFDEDYFDDEFTFEKFNSLGATEVTLLKAASSVDKTEDSLGDFVESLQHEELNTLKAFAESFNKNLKEHKDMSEDKVTEVQKALDAQLVELEKAQGLLTEANDKLADIEKAKAETARVEYVELAKSFGAEEELGNAMAVVSMSEQGEQVIKALEDAHKRLAELIEKEAGFSGESVDTSSEESDIMKAMKAKYESK